MVAAEPGLDRHEGISDPRTGCPRWPEHLWLLNETTGELVVGRCKATNLCRYCQLLYVLETVEMLLLDAAEHAPQLWAVLTAREHLSRRDTYRHLEALRRAVRRRWAEAEWFVQVEFQRRGALHLNLLVKGVPVEDREQLHELLSERWCARVDAEDPGQWVGEVAQAGGIVKYLAKTLGHGLKAEQAPPIGWRGHRTSQTRGYLVRPASVMREEARAARRLKRALRAAIAAGEKGHDAELVAHQALEAAAAATWTLRVVTPAKRPVTDREAPAGVPEPIRAAIAAKWHADARADVAAVDLRACGAVAKGRAPPSGAAPGPPTQPSAERAQPVKRPPPG